MRGHVKLRGDVWYAFFRINGKLICKSLPDCNGKREAEAACRKLLEQIDSGDFVMTDKTTVAEWIEHWLSIGAPGKRKKAIGAKAQERYGEMMRSYVMPALGHKQLQKLQATEIDQLYTDLSKRLADRSVHATHVVFSSALARAFAMRKIGCNPMLDLLRTPAYGEADHGMVLDAKELARLVRGFFNTGSTIAPIVATAAYTGARRGEILALRWSDLE
jgi:integrase